MDKVDNPPDIRDRLIRENMDAVEGLSFHHWEPLIGNNLSIFYHDVLSGVLKAADYVAKVFDPKKEGVFINFLYAPASREVTNLIRHNKFKKRSYHLKSTLDDSIDIIDPNSEKTSDFVDSELIMEFYESLSERDKFVLGRRFGLNGYREAESRREIAEDQEAKRYFNFTSNNVRAKEESIRQAEKRALKRLRFQLFSKD